MVGGGVAILGGLVRGEGNLCEVVVNIRFYLIPDHFSRFGVWLAGIFFVGGRLGIVAWNLNG